MEAFSWLLAIESIEVVVSTMPGSGMAAATGNSLSMEACGIGSLEVTYFFLLAGIDILLVYGSIFSWSSQKTVDVFSAFSKVFRSHSFLVLTSNRLTQHSLV